MKYEIPNTTYKKERCPICRRQYTKQNPKVLFHITYVPERTTIACKFCNFAEFRLRNGLPLPKKWEERNPYAPNRPSRLEMLTLFLYKHGIIYQQ